MALATLLARLQLRRQTEVLGLIFGADAHVDDGADHFRQLGPVWCPSQFCAHALMDRRSLFVDEHLDHGLRDALRTDADSIDVVAQVDRFLAEQLATALNRDLVVRLAG